MICWKDLCNGNLTLEKEIGLISKEKSNKKYVGRSSSPVMHGMNYPNFKFYTERKSIAIYRW